jgi:RNA polymerase I-specific transcription initiation factor RRN11
MASIFLFDSNDSKMPSTERKQHIKTLFDVLHVSILRQDLLRARRAWAILVRCPDVDTQPLWRIGLGLILGWPDESEESQAKEQVRFLKGVLTSEKGDVRQGLDAFL